jgi:hypothetical protein
MRIFVLALVASLSSIAHADEAGPKPELVFTWESGEMSRDMSIWRTRITVTGTKLHYERSYSGRNGGMPGTKPVQLDATVKDPKKVAAALAALDKLKVKPVKQADRGPDRFNLRSGCIERGTTSRCASVDGNHPDSDELKAIAAVRDALMTGVKVPGELTLD